MAVIPILGKLRQEDGEFEASLSFMSWNGMEQSGVFKAQVVYHIGQQETVPGCLCMSWIYHPAS